MENTLKQKIDKWLNGPVDQETKNAIVEMIQTDPTALKDAFGQDLAFGTGGLRGIMGIGTSRMNVYTVQKATQGLSNYLLKEIKDQPIFVLIGFDSRHNSKLFAQESARVLAGNGIHVYLLEEIRPTPYVSFACRFKKCHAAIMITASHNPKEYNGYKVYWGDGAQVVNPHDIGIMEEAALVQNFSDIKISRLHDPFIQVLDASLDNDYLFSIFPLQTHPEENKQYGKEIKIVYTSLHGTGISIVPKALQSWGFTNILYVKEQIEPDGDFPTVQFPNPEYKEALSLGIKTLIETQSDIVIANDPDADRMGIVIMHKGKPVILNGNETSSIFMEYLCQSLQEKNKLPPKASFVTTIVSTDLLQAIAHHYQCPFFEVLTGFKYIGEKIHEWEDQPGGNIFIFGAEESYGYLYGTHARDKDAIICSCLAAEVALMCKRKGITLIDFLEDLYKKYGIFREDQLSISFSPGNSGMEMMRNLMSKIRKNPPFSFLGSKMVSLEDYSIRKKKNLLSGVEEPLHLPESDVLLYRFDNGNKLVIRPSGTEPKLKIYAGVRQEQFSSIQEGIKACDEQLKALLSAMKEKLLS